MPTKKNIENELRMLSLRQKYDVHLSRGQGQQNIDAIRAAGALRSTVRARLPSRQHTCLFFLFCFVVVVFFFRLVRVFVS